jgi:hypothetical protein
MSTLFCTVASRGKEASADTEGKAPKQIWEGGEDDEAEGAGKSRPGTEAEPDAMAESEARDEEETGTDEEAACADRDKKIPGAS